METISDVWTRHRELVATLIGRQRPEVERLTDQAMGYVWGFQDAGGEVKNTDRASEFGWRYGIVAARYALSEIGGRPPIQDAWQSFQAWGEIRDYRSQRLDV